MNDDIDTDTVSDEDWVPDEEQTHDPAAEKAAEKAEKAKAVEPEPEVEDEPEEDEEEDDAVAKRMARLAHERREAKRELRALRAEIEVLRGERTETRDEEMQRAISQQAQELARTARYDEKCDEIYHAGSKELGKAKFDSAVAAIHETLGGLPRPFIEALMDASEKPHALLHYLGENTDILDDISHMSPARQGAALARIDAKLSAPKAKPVSKAPPPIKPVTGASRAEVDLDSMPMEEYIRYMDAHDAKRRRGG